jgi:hypothetical protein
MTISMPSSGVVNVQQASFNDRPPTELVQSQLQHLDSRSNHVKARHLQELSIAVRGRFTSAKSLPESYT